MADHRFSRNDRLRSREDFRRVFQEEAFAADGVLVVRGCRNLCGRSRLGLSISRRVGSAVLRNRWKRLIREVFRQQREQFPLSLDIVVRPKKGARPSYEAIARSLPPLVRLLERRLPPQRPAAEITSDHKGAT